MEYLHSKKIVFQDLKPDNVGFDSAGVLKMFDFGFAVGLWEKDESNPVGFLFDRCGTPGTWRRRWGCPSGTV
jgi:serine/threonine protein kinase